MKVYENSYLIINILMATWDPNLVKFHQEYKGLTETKEQEYNNHLIDKINVE